MWCFVCLLPSHRKECLPVHFFGVTPLRYSSGFWTCCNGSRLRSSIRRWARLCPWHLQGARGCWTYAPWFCFWGVSSLDSGVRCRSSCSERPDEITRLVWARSRCQTRCRTRSCILYLRCSFPLRGWRACLIWPSWRGWIPAWFFRVANLFLKFFFFVLLDWAWSDTVAKLAALVIGNFPVDICCYFTFALFVVLANDRWLSRCTDPPCINPGPGCHSSMRLYADVTDVRYSSLPFGILFSISRRSPSYRRDEFCINTISCIFSVANSLALSMSAESAASHVIVEPFLF